MEKSNKNQISESGQPDGNISHLKRRNSLLHMVWGSRGLNSKIQLCVENFFLAYLLTQPRISDLTTKF